MSTVLLALWVALIGADRIDLAGGHASFLVTPFLFMTPVVAISELARRLRCRRPVMVRRQHLLYALAASALLAVVLTSTFLSDSVGASAARSTQLFAEVAGTFTVVLLASDRSRLAQVMARGALLSLPLYVCCDVMETLWFLGRAPELWRLGSATLRFDDIQTLGPVPRLSGPVGDANRAGFIMLAYGVMMAKGDAVIWRRRAGIGVLVVLLALTISRSATLGAVTTLVLTALARRRRVSIPVAATGFAAVAVVAALALWQPRLRHSIASLAYSPIASRVSLSEGSAEDHLTLLRRGLQTATESVPRALHGLGYGNSYLVLQDIFPGNKYGNFHSLFVTMFAESGVFALLLSLLLVGAPLMAGGPWRPLIAGTVAFNLFYQTTSEPMFWFVLALAWFTMPRARPREAAPPR